MTQPPFRTDLYLREFVLTQQDLSTWQGFPYDTARTGTFYTGVQAVNCWFLTGNGQSITSISLRFLRPDGSVRFAGQPITVNSARNAYYRLNYNVNLDVTGTWNLELSLNGHVVALVPFRVFSTGTQPSIRPPAAVQAAFDPPAPTSSQVLFARVTSSPLFADPDYQFLRYHYVWKVNGSTIRDVVSAGLGDAIAHDSTVNGDTITCTITPSDGISSAPASQISTVVGGTAGNPAFFDGETALGDGVYYLQFPASNIFGYYSFLTDPHYIYHFDLGYEYVFDTNDGKSGVYLYDFKSGSFFYTSPTFPFPFLYDFTLNTVLYYYPDPAHAGHYNTNGYRFFYDFATGRVITK